MEKGFMRSSSPNMGSCLMAYVEGSMVGNVGGSDWL